VLIAKTSDSQLESKHIINEPITIYKLQGPMTNFRISALVLALSPLWVSASVSAEELNQVDPVSAIDAKSQRKTQILSVFQQPKYQRLRT